MIALALWLASFVAPDTARLGHDQWPIREAETERCDNLVLALLLPDRSEDPEVNYRVARLRTRNLKWLRAEYVERVALRVDTEEWVRLFLVTGRSRIAPEWDTFVWLHEDGRRADAMFAAWPPSDGTRGWLYGGIVLSEYGRWLDHIDYHQWRAPAPREVLADPSR